MEAIPAAHDLKIEFSADSWRLVSTELLSPTTLVDASPEGITTHPVFRAARALSSATISPGQVGRVILGWAPENEAWRLGVLLIDGAAGVQDTIQMQWCELAAWPKPTHDTDLETLKFVGQSLARLMGRPFQLVGPSTPSRVAAFQADLLPDEDADDNSTPTKLDADTPIATSRPKPPTVESVAVVVNVPDIHLRPLPITFADWHLRRIGVGMVWQRPRSWWLINMVRLGGILLATILFFVLSIGSLTRGLASVEPDWLPFLGMGMGAILMLALGRLLWQLLNAQQVFIDRYQRLVYEQGSILPLVRWRIGFDAIQYLLITQDPPRSQGRRRAQDPMRIAQDVWLHAYDGHRFYLLAQIEDVIGQSYDWEAVRMHGRTKTRRALQLAEYDTPAHHAAQQIAAIIEVPVYMDLI